MCFNQILNKRTINLIVIFCRCGVVWCDLTRQLVEFSRTLTGILNPGKNFLANLQIKIFFVKIGFNFVNLSYTKKTLNFFFNEQEYSFNWDTVIFTELSDLYKTTKSSAKRLTVRWEVIWIQETNALYGKTRASCAVFAMNSRIHVFVIVYMWFFSLCKSLHWMPIYTCIYVSFFSIIIHACLGFSNDNMWSFL